MATTTITARPAQALRQRRESQRPGIARVNTRATTAEAADSVAPSIPTPYGTIWTWRGPLFDKLC